MTVGDMTERMKASDKILIEDNKKTKLYKGYVACLQHGEVDQNLLVQKISIGTEVRKRRQRETWQEKILPGESEPLEADASTYRFEDLSFDIFLKIEVEESGQKKRTVD